MNICINTDINAPCCPCEILADDGRSILIQTDWDFPGTAATFGWSPADVQREADDDDEPAPHCNHDGTDGTVDCKECGMRAGDFIAAAREFLESSDGLTVEDPGYFD